MTFLTGFPLLILVYYVTGGVYLVDPAVSSITPGRAVALGVGLLIVVLDRATTSCGPRRSPVAEAEPAAGVSWVLLFAVVYGLTHVLSGRAAFIHVGAMLGTIMAANVWMRIMPRAARSDRRRRGRSRRRPHALEPGQAALHAQQLRDVPGDLHDAQQPLPPDVRPPARTGSCSRS